MNYYQRNRARQIAERKKADRIETIKSIAYALLALPIIWALVWLAYFATI